MLSFVMVMVCTIVIYMGYFVSFENGSTIPYSIITWLLCIFFAYELNRNKRERKNFLIKEIIIKKALLYFVCISITILNFYYNRYGKPVIMDSDYENFIIGNGAYTTLKASSFKFGYVYISMMFSYVIYTMYKHFNIDDIIFVANKFLKYSSVSIFVGYVEFLTENLFQTLMVTNSTVFFFGEAGSQQIELTFDRGWSNIQAFTREASMYSTSVLYSVIVAINMIALNRKNRLYYYYTFFAFVILLLNSSMSSYVYATIVVLFIAYIRPFNSKSGVAKINLRMVVYLIIVVTFMLIVSKTVIMSDTYLSTRINQSLTQLENFNGQGFTYSSEGVRFLGITHCLSIFVDRPLFGIGFGCVTCVSGVVTLLTNIGLLGFLSYLILIWPIIQTNKGEKFLVIMLLVIIPNLLLNDLNTMFAIIIPFVVLMTSYIIMIKKTSYSYEDSFKTNHN